MASPQELRGTDIALRRYVGKKIHDVSGYRKGSFIGLLQGFDTFYNEPGRGKRFDKVALNGGDMQINLSVGVPEWQGSDAQNPDWEQRRVPITSNVDLLAGTVKPSAQETVEGIDRYRINRLKNNADIQNYVRWVGDKLVEGWLQRIEKDLFPTVNLVGGAGTQPGNIKNLMPLAYPLQSGYATNALTGTGTYMYMGHDMNAIPTMKALNVGTDATPWVLTPSNIRKDLLMPLRQLRGASPDLILIGSLGYNYLANFFDGKMISNDFKKNFKFGLTFFEFEGIPFVYEPMLDALPLPEMYVLDTSTWRFGLSEDPASALVMIENPQQYPSGVLYQGYIEDAFFCENPRLNARAYNYSIPA